MSLVVRKPVFGVSDQVPHKPGCQPHKMARGLKFRLKEVEGLYYLCSENNGADQLRGYREADLCLCFRIFKKPVFSGRGSNIVLPHYYTPHYNTDFSITGSCLESQMVIFLFSNVNNLIIRCKRWL